MTKRLTIEEAKQKQPNLVDGQKWRGNHFKYKYICEKHGVYLKRFDLHSKSQIENSCPKCYARNRCRAAGMSHLPEYKTVVQHFRCIFESKNKHHKSYKGTPFFDGWNPKKGGSWLAGAEWILKNLGERPKGCSMHIVEHEKGFIPGNLEWAHPRKQSSQKMFKIIADLRHRIKQLEKQLEFQEKA